MSSSTNPAPAVSASLGSFTPERYRADGAASLGSLFQLIGLTGMAGLVLGMIASWISQFFYFIVMFPFAIGLGVGAVGKWCIRRFHVRNPLYCGLAGFVAGALAMLSMHATDYSRFESRLTEGLGADGQYVREIARRSDDIRANWDSATPEEQEIVAELEKNPEGMRALKVDSIWSFIDMNAHNGVVINPKAGGNGGGLNLGYQGSYIYWFIETLIVAGVAYSIMSSAAGEPYCGQCSNWKSGVAHGPFANSEDVRQIVESGDLRPFPIEGEGVPIDALVTLFTCPQCEHDGTIDVLVERFTVNGKGETSKKQLANLTYPAAAYVPLTLACTAMEVAREEARAKAAVVVENLSASEPG